MSKPCTKDCDLINPIYEGEINESWWCRDHERPYWANKDSSGVDKAAMSDDRDMHRKYREHMRKIQGLPSQERKIRMHGKPKQKKDARIEVRTHSHKKAKLERIASEEQLKGGISELMDEGADYIIKNRYKSIWDEDND